MTIVRNILSIASLILLAMATLVYAIATANACEQRDPSGLFCDDPKPEPERRYHHEHRRPEVRSWIMRRPEPPEPPKRLEDSDPLDRIKENTLRPRCYPAVRTVGDQYASENGAKQEAIKAWSQQVRHDFGERAMDFDHAQFASFACVRSSIGSIVGQTFHRCEVIARPCHPQHQQVDK